jgi:hypothetical protein
MIEWAKANPTAPAMFGDICTIEQLNLFLFLFCCIWPTNKATTYFSKTY